MIYESVIKPDFCPYNRERAEDASNEAAGINLRFFFFYGFFLDPPVPIHRLYDTLVREIMVERLASDMGHREMEGFSTFYVRVCVWRKRETFLALDECFF